MSLGHVFSSHNFVLAPLFLSFDGFAIDNGWGGMATVSRRSQPAVRTLSLQPNPKDTFTRLLPRIPGDTESCYHRESSDNSFEH